MKKDQKVKYDHMIARFEDNMETLRGFIQISDVSFPRVEKLTEKACTRARRANKCIQAHMVKN